MKRKKIASFFLFIALGLQYLCSIKQTLPMAQRLEQTQAAVQTQQLASLQVAVAKLVELPVTELAARVRDEMVDNAALEEKDGEDYPTHDEADNTDNNDNNEENDKDAEADEANAYEESEDYGREADAMGDYFSADDVPDYLQQRADEERDRKEMQYSGQTSFYEDLQQQISEHNLTEHEQEVMEYIIGSLDEDGFLRKDLDALADELAIYHNINTDRHELERLLSILQQFEPRGIGARSLQECLHIQLTDPERRTPYTKLALEVVDRCFKDFVGRHWDVVKQRLGMDDDTFAHVRHLLVHLNPRPGSALNDSTAPSAPTVVPDFYVRVDDEGRVEVGMNNGDVPELRVSQAFRDSIKQYGGNKTKLSREQRDAYTYARQKVDSALSFINLLTRRKETLMSVMRAIVDKQHAFFVNDDDENDLVPLTLKEIAEMARVDISTVSRVTNSKYVQTMYGTYPLKFFFSSQFTTSDGDELSARKVKAALRELIDGEDKRHPLSDEALAAKLKKAGYNVARRTVAKYRDMLGLPTARLRKE